VPGRITLLIVSITTINGISKLFINKKISLLSKTIRHNDSTIPTLCK